MLLSYPQLHEEVKRGGRGCKIESDYIFLVLCHNVASETDSRSEGGEREGQQYRWGAGNGAAQWIMDRGEKVSVGVSAGTLPSAECLYGK